MLVPVAILFTSLGVSSFVLNLSELSPLSLLLWRLAKGWTMLSIFSKSQVSVSVVVRFFCSVFPRFCSAHTLRCCEGKTNP